MTVAGPLALLSRTWQSTVPESHEGLFLGPLSLLSNFHSWYPGRAVKKVELSSVHPVGQASGKRASAETSGCVHTGKWPAIDSAPHPLTVALKPHLSASRLVVESLHSIHIKETEDPVCIGLYLCHPVPSPG